MLEEELSEMYKEFLRQIQESLEESICIDGYWEDENGITVFGNGNGKLIKFPHKLFIKKFRECKEDFFARETAAKELGAYIIEEVKRGE